MRLEPVRTRAELDAFVELPLRLQPRHLSVPMDAGRLRRWWRGRSAHTGVVELFVLRDDAGEVVARTTVHDDRRLDERLGARNRLFGATEFASPAAASALLAELERLARRRGDAQLFGPVSLLPNQAGGVITSGFERRGFVDSAWNPDWYPTAYESAGFVRWGEADTWVVEARGAPPPTASELADAGVRLEYGARRRMRELVPELRELLNASFAALPYYTPITAEEMAEATAGLAHLLDERLLLLARDAATGRLVSFVLVVPDITAFVQRVGGDLSLVNQLRLLATRRRYRRAAILVIQGTDPGRQGRGILGLLSRQLQANLADGGYERLRSTYVGRDNPASARQFSRFGGTPLHGYTFYRKALA